MTRYRHDYILKRTCDAWPERYDVILSGELIGVIRFRTGVITADYDYAGEADQVYILDWLSKQEYPHEPDIDGSTSRGGD